MARIWIEPYQAHSGPPMDYWGSAEAAAHWRAPTIVPKNVLVVSVASFTFHFFSVEQLRDCLAYYEQKTHPSSRLPVGGMDHWEAQRWFERLPMYLLEEPKRAKVVKALNRALTVAESGAFSGHRER
jgi:type VI protein secretion system component VasA